MTSRSAERWCKGQVLGSSNKYTKQDMPFSVYGTNYIAIKSTKEESACFHVLDKPVVEH